jgi:hypothetical protein
VPGTPFAAAGTTQLAGLHQLPQLLICTAPLVLLTHSKLVFGVSSLPVGVIAPFVTSTCIGITNPPDLMKPLYLPHAEPVNFGEGKKFRHRGDCARDADRS